MKQHSPLRRVTPLQRTTALTSTVGLARSGMLRRTALKPKHPRDFTENQLAAREAEHAVRNMACERARGLCEMCGKRDGCDFSHRWAEGQCGPYILTNGLWACRLCHTHAHGHPTAAKARGWFIAPMQETVDDRKTDIDVADVPAYIFRSQIWGPEWVLLNNEGGADSIDFDDLERRIVRFRMGRIA